MSALNQIKTMGWHHLSTVGTDESVDDPGEVAYKVTFIHPDDGKLPLTSIVITSREKADADTDLPDTMIERAAGQALEALNKEHHAPAEGDDWAVPSLASRLRQQ